MNPLEVNNSEAAPPGNRRSGVWLSIVLPTIIGGVIGSYFVGPYVRHNATPEPYVVAFGFCGLAALLASLVIRFLRRSLSDT